MLTAWLLLISPPKNSIITLKTPLYLKNIHNIEQVIKKNNYYKFLILNIEYDVDAEIALKCIAKDINDGTLSSLALEQFIKTTCVDGCDNVRKLYPTI